MHRIIKFIIKTVSLLGGFALIMAATLIPESANIAFSRVTGLIEAYNNVETTALSIIPDEIEAFISRLYNAIC